MSEAYLGEIRIVSFTFAPKGWAFCNGQLLPINNYQALFSIMGTTYGGNGVTTFALPNLQGRVPVHTGGGIALGQAGGEASHALTAAEMPMHNHPATAHTAASTPGTSPAGALWASGANAAYGSTPNTTMSPASVTNVGGGQAHENRPPYLVLNAIVCLSGLFPSRP